MKTCVDCRQDLAIELFHKDKSLRSGLKPYCKKCHSLRIARYRIGRRNTPEGWVKDIVYGLRYRASRKGVPCSITASDIVIPERCPIRGTAFVLGVPGHPDAPSVDRRDPDLGYVVGNVSVISQKANMMKSDCTDPDVFRRLADWMEAGNALNLAQAGGFLKAI